MSKILRSFSLSNRRLRSGSDPLVDFLKSARGTPVTVSVEDVSRLDAHRLQTLLAARRQWALDCQPLHIHGASAAFRDGLERLGLSPDFFDKDTAA